jgi:hypothetical protein
VEKVPLIVIPNEVRNLSVHETQEKRDSSARGVPRNDSVSSFSATCQWGEKSEFRIQVSLEREISSAIPIADRYYCCNFYVSEEQAASLRTGKPLRIKFEQD